MAAGKPVGFGELVSALTGHGYRLAEVRAMTRRQLVLFYNQALGDRQRQQADLLDTISVAMTGKASKAAKQIRETL